MITPIEPVNVAGEAKIQSAPSADVLVLPINNTRAENLSAYLGRELLARLAQRFPELDVRRLELSVEETPGQRGVYAFVPD